MWIVGRAEARGCYGRRWSHVCMYCMYYYVYSQGGGYMCGSHRLSTCTVGSKWNGEVGRRRRVEGGGEQEEE